jgi:hypothetical protein
MSKVRKKGKKKPTKGLLKRWNTHPLNVNMILSSMDPSDVYVLGASVNAFEVSIVTDLIHALPGNSSATQSNTQR